MYPDLWNYLSSSVLAHILARYLCRLGRPDGTFAEVQTSSTAHAASEGVCSVRVVGTQGEGPELLLNDGAGTKTGELSELPFACEAALGDVVYVEFKNNSATTWRPHWAKVYARMRRPTGRVDCAF